MDDRTTTTTADTSASQGSPRSTTPEPDWTDQVTDLIVESVDKVKTRTTGPILEISRGAVHAIVALIVIIPTMVLGVVLAVRLLNYYVFREVWITYAVLGTIFVLAGLLMWSRREPRPS